MREVIGLILAGGRSSRMGADKAFVELDGKSLLAHVHASLMPQCEDVVVSANSDDVRFADYRIVRDTVPGQPGPLAGILAGLEAADSARVEWLVTAPVDCPFMPDDLVERLCRAMGGSALKIALASSAGQTHPVLGLWHVSLVEPIRKALVTGERAVGRFAAPFVPILVEWADIPFDPFFNINTQEDLALARLQSQRLLSRF